ncbi:hypothetical protein LCGC14_1934950 [marine sediment metagenome]|uniref:Uncharacterized protein n=1 Tax=marine sediment metagenome TaxID=412755 RepID=A0A0F9I0L6_9ZZZZ
MTEKEMDNYIKTLVKFSEKICKQLSYQGSNDCKDYRQSYDIATEILCAKIIAGGK